MGVRTQKQVEDALENVYISTFKMKKRIKERKGRDENLG